MLNPVSRTYLKATAADASVHGLTAYQWRVLRRAVRERFDAPDHVLSLAAARNAIRDVVDQAVQKPSRRRRVRAARYSGEFQGVPTPCRNRQIRLAKRLNGFRRNPISPRSDVAEESASLSNDAAAPVDPATLDVDDWDVAC